MLVVDVSNEITGQAHGRQRSRAAAYDEALMRHN
jgi:hypothetical protein